MSVTFSGGRFILPSATSEVFLPSKPSTAVSIGDLMIWDATNKWVVPVSDAILGVAFDTVAELAPAFVGVALQGKLAADTTKGYPGVTAGGEGITIASDCIYEATCASAAFDIGTTVGPVATSAGDFTVVANATTAQIIGYVTSQYTAAATRIRVRLVGKFSPFRYADIN